MTEVKSLGVPGTRFVKMNSNLNRRKQVMYFNVISTYNQYLFCTENSSFNFRKEVILLFCFGLDFIVEGKYVPGMVALGEDVERFRHATQLGVHCPRGDVQDAAEANC
jgi:hypothetical protein